MEKKYSTSFGKQCTSPPSFLAIRHRSPIRSPSFAAHGSPHVELPPAACCPSRVACTLLAARCRLPGAECPLPAPSRPLAARCEPHLVPCLARAALLPVDVPVPCVAPSTDHTLPTSFATFLAAAPFAAAVASSVETSRIQKNLHQVHCTSSTESKCCHELGRHWLRAWAWGPVRVRLKPARRKDPGPPHARRKEKAISTQAEKGA